MGLLGDAIGTLLETTLAGGGEDTTTVGVELLTLG
tara:strand:+ start:310 stop:414 length:105 start_codon:yes stop_codon:yes gene_type:complete